MGWIAHGLLVGPPEVQAFALKTLEKASRVRRGRHLVRFREVADRSDADLAARLAALFGPLLGGTPRPVTRPVEPPQAAGAEDLARLQAFFNRSGGSR